MYDTLADVLILSGIVLWLIVAIVFLAVATGRITYDGEHDADETGK